MFLVQLVTFRQSHCSSCPFYLQPTDGLTFPFLNGNVIPPVKTTKRDPFSSSCLTLLLVILFGSAHHILLPDFQCLSFSRTNSVPTLLCQAPWPYILFPRLWLTTPNLGNLVSRFHTKKGTKCKGNQNKTTSVVCKPLHFTGLHGC